jgi:hypothetical protein
MGLFDFFKPKGGTIKGVVEGAGKVVDSVGSAAVKIREAITGDIPSDIKLRLEGIAAELEKQKTELDKTIIETTNQINLEYAKKDSWFFSGWRPAFAWIGVGSSKRCLASAFRIGSMIFSESNFIKLVGNLDI